MTFSGLRWRTMDAADGRMTHAWNRSMPRRRAWARTYRPASQALRRRAHRRLCSGITSGVTAKMFVWTCTAPRRYCRTLRRIRDASATLAAGRLSPIEFTQSTRFVRARIFMTWCLLVGSASQSLAKQMMFCPVITARLLQGHHTLAGHVEAPRRVARVDHELRGVDDLAVVEVDVVGHNHDAVGGGQALLRQLDRLQRLPVLQHQRGHVRVRVRYVRALVLQRGDDLERRRLAHVADAALVGDAEDEDVGAVEAPLALVQRLRHQLDDIGRHRTIDLVGQVDEAELIAIQAHLPRQVKGIDA